MTKQTTQQKLNLAKQMIISTLSVIALSSCGNSKSAELNTTNSSSNNTISSQKPLANCNKSATADMSMNTSTVNDSAGQIDPNWTKVKFNFLSTKSTAAGNVVRFFKWKVSGAQSSLDPSALSTMFYNLENGQPTTNAANSVPVEEIATTRGIYVQLNDSAGQYQVLKAVVYDSAGKIVAQMNTLIPQFSSSYSDYRLNSDGSARAQVLLDLHPLKATDATSWTASSYSTYFQNFCF
jgi:hypothetical protein